MAAVHGFDGFFYGNNLLLSNHLLRNSQCLFGGALSSNMCERWHGSHGLINGAVDFVQLLLGKLDHPHEILHSRCHVHFEEKDTEQTQ
jgi:hypothetical protein